MKKQEDITKVFKNVSKTNQANTGILAINETYNILCLENNRYLKIYMLKTALGTTERKEAFVRGVNNVTHNRMRISSFCVIDEAKITSYLFLTVFFEGLSHDNVISQVQDFENNFNLQLIEPLQLNVEACKIEDVMRCVHLNYTGEMKKYDKDTILSTKSNWMQDVFVSPNKVHKGIFNNEYKFGKCFIAKQLPENIQELSDMYKSLNGTVYFSVDIQHYTDEEKHVYFYDLNSKYNSRKDNQNDEIVNYTYLLSIMNDKENLSEMEQKIKDMFLKNNIYLVPAMGREKKIFDSICTLGVLDYTSMENGNIEAVCNLLL